MLQHAGKCCNTLQHTAVYCNSTCDRTQPQLMFAIAALQHVATHDTHSATHGNILQHVATQCNTSFDSAQPELMFAIRSKHPAATVVEFLKSHHANIFTIQKNSQSQRLRISMFAIQSKHPAATLVEFLKRHLATIFSV